MPDLKDSQRFGNTSNNLPLQLTSFVGRETEIETLTRLLGETRLLTLTGAGGVGKTRIGLEVAAPLLGEFEDGVWLVELGSIYEPQLVVHKVSSTLGCRGEGSKTRLEILKEYLHRKDLLLVLDNCEHLLDACAKLVLELLLACPDLQVLVTSREPLGVPGETVYEVQPLSLPDFTQPLNRSNVLQSETAQLFIERARSFQSSFQFDDQTAPMIAQICSLLDGIPLAVELAAARVRVLSPAQIAEYLKNSMQFLTTGARTAVSRHQTLLDSIE